MTTRRTFLRTAIGFGVASTVTSLPAFAAGHGRTGTFTGASGHVTTGGAEIDGNTINLLADFQFDGAPDPKVALGNNGYDPATLLEPLRSNSGAQSYEVPASIDTSQYNEVWIWCEQYSVPLGVAKIN